MNVRTLYSKRDASIFCFLAKWKPLNGQNQVRFKKISERMPQEPNYDRKLMLATVEPIFKLKTLIPTSLTCGNLHKKEPEVHPYVKILADEYIDYFRRSPLVAYYHLQPIGDRLFRKAYNTLFKKGFILKNYDNEISQVALKNTNWEPLLKFYQRSAATVVAFGDNFNVKPILEIEKSSPFLTLLFAVHQDRILRKDEVQALVDLSKDHTNYELAYLLSQTTKSLVQVIGHNSQKISDILQQRCRQLNNEKP